MAAQEQEPAVQFAQRLASNERPARGKALKKLRKYMAARSQRAKGAFTADELLKLWKGLFYCLWMQDKPLLQEELCAQLSGLLHCLHNTDAQFLFLDTFLQTINREWNGIDRLRMDKFYMLVRFVFRQTFEMLKRKNWDKSLVERFREVLTQRILHSTSEAPSGVQFHIVDFYLEELGRVGAVQLRAEQNLFFIDPFCKVAAKTKNHTFMQAICSGIFQEIVDQAPFAIEDLMREVLKKGRVQGEDSVLGDDSDQASAEEEEVERTAAPRSSKKAKGKQLNGLLPGGDDEDEDERSDFGEGFSYVLDDGESPGPMLQFDYKALAERLLQYASRLSVSNFNRNKLYGLVKIFQGLSEGRFPRDGYPAEVSTDEDDYERFGSRKRLRKRRRNQTEEDGEEGASATKKRKGKKEAKVQEKQKKGAQADKGTPNDTVIKKKKKNKGKKGNKEEGPKQDEISADDLRGAPVQCELPAAEETADGVRKKKGTGQRKNGSASVVTPELQDLGGTIEAEPASTGEPGKAGEVAPVQEMQSTDDVSTQKKKKKRRRRSKRSSLQEDKSTSGSHPLAVPEGRVDEPSGGVEKEGVELEDAAEMSICQVADSKNKKKKKGKVQQMEQEEVQQGAGEAHDADACAAGAVADEDPSSESPLMQEKKKKKNKKKIMKRKLIAEPPEATEEKPVKINGDAVRGGAKKTTESQDVSSSASAKKPRKDKSVAGGQDSFASFQSPSVPVPLFCRSKKGSPTKQLFGTPRSESKKVTFGLKNNKTAEFRKTDRSLLVSPDGSSRVPFDPQQKPQFGVLKSSLRAQTNKKSKGVPKRRPCAADFF